VLKHWAKGFRPWRDWRICFYLQAASATPYRRHTGASRVAHALPASHFNRASRRDLQIHGLAIPLARDRLLHGLAIPLDRDRLLHADLNLANRIHVAV
jgi:hypothetical protein